MLHNWSYYLVWCLCLGLQSYGQTNTPAPESSLCPALQAFNGEWRYTNGSDTIRIYFRYHECYFTGTGTPELRGRLWGWHEYKKGDTVIVSDYQNRFMPLPDFYKNTDFTKVSILLVLPACDASRGRLLGVITDYLQAMERKSVRAYFDTAITKIIPKLLV